MNTRLVSTIFALGALMTSAAQATTYYVSDCQTGASAGCTAGNDANAGTSASAPWKSTAKVQAMFASLAAGDSVLFARGGSWLNASMAPLQNLKSSASSPITFDAYTPSSGATARPILTEARSGTNMLAFDNNGAAVADGGYVIKNLDLRGGGTGQWGVFTSQLTSDIILSNVNIQGFDIGMHCGENIERVQLLNSTITNNGSQGVLWGCNNSLIQGNTFSNNGYVSTDGRDHSVYLGNGTSSANNVTMRGNTLINNSVPLSGGSCNGVPLVVHGMWNGVTLEGNTIYQAPGTSLPGCWGIAVDTGYDLPEIYQRVVIRGNTIVNVGGLGIGCAACVAPLIENNVIVMEGATDLIGIQIPDRATGTGDAADTGAIVRNNTIYFKAPSFAQGISLASQGASTAGTKVQIVSNLVYFGATSNTNHQCFDTTGVSLANFQAFDYNLCFDTSANGRYSPAYATLSAAKSAGFDAHGLSADPKFAVVPSSSNKWSVALSATSPAINAGSPTGSSLVDILSVSRSAPDIGAFEYGSVADTVAPAPPQSVNIQ